MYSFKIDLHCSTFKIKLKTFSVSKKNKGEINDMILTP